MKSVSVFVFAIMGLVASSCHAEKAPVSIRGEIMMAKGSGILVEGKKEDDTSHDKAMVTIIKKTTILRVEGELLKPATADDLKKGVRVEITFTGPVKESYPVQADARRIVILPNEEKKNKEEKK